MIALARTTDPDTSHEAATHMTVSGKRALQMGIAVVAVTARPGLTSLELAKASKQCRFMLARRLPEAEEQNKVYRGPVRQCRESGRRAATWYPVEPNQQLELVS